MNDINDAINPRTLKAARKQQKMTQQQLADAIRCTKDTISRWERGKSKRVRSHLREPLCKVLRIKWEKLIEPTEQNQVVQRDFTTKVSISRETRISLQLVAERYNVRPRTVLDLAPLLFLIVAEHSLLERKRRLEKIYKVMEESDEQLIEYGAHLGEIITARSFSAEEQLEEEEKSLEQRDIFGSKIEYFHWDEDHEGPFVRFLENLTNGLPKDAVTKIYGFDDTINYRIADDTLRECTGISEEEETGASLLHYISCGRIDFAECLRVKRKEDEENYRKWLSTELEKNKEIDAQFMRSFLK